MCGFGFTRQEQTVVLWLVITLLMGCVITYYKRHFYLSHQAGWSNPDNLKEEFHRKSNLQLKPKEEGLNKGPGSPKKFLGQERVSKAVGLVNVNTATVEELQQVPGIGPVIAQRIVSYREQVGSFQNLEQLREIRGIGEKNFQKIRASLTVKCSGLSYGFFKIKSSNLREEKWP